MAVRHVCDVSTPNPGPHLVDDVSCLVVAVHQCPVVGVHLSISNRALKVVAEPAGRLSESTTADRADRVLEALALDSRVVGEDRHIRTVTGVYASQAHVSVLACCPAGWSWLVPAAAAESLCLNTHLPMGSWLAVSGWRTLGMGTKKLPAASRYQRVWSPLQGGRGGGSNSSSNSTTQRSMQTA
jgi:hypothetical protein